jgi:hypothetical protein
MVNLITIPLKLRLSDVFCTEVFVDFEKGKNAINGKQKSSILYKTEAKGSC